MDNHKRQSLVQNKNVLGIDVCQNNNNKKTNKKQKYSNISNILEIGEESSNTKIHQQISNNNIINFIKQKKKFFIENSFDYKGTREFLASKEVAMRVIKLNDEIIEEQKNNNLSNNNSIKMHFLDTEEDLPKNYKRNKSSKVEGKKTISPRKSRKTNKKMISDNQITKLGNIKIKKHKMDKKVKNENKGKHNSINLIENSNKDTDKENIIIFDKESNDSQSEIFKFIIDHANEEEENFDKMLKKELEKVGNLKNKKNKVKKNASKKDLKLPPKRFNSVVFLKNRKTESIFQFSEINKNLMKNDNINLSSISGESNCDSLHKKTKKGKCDSNQINNRQIKEKKKKKKNKGKFDNNNKIKNKIDINSDKESIISILSDLM